MMIRLILQRASLSSSKTSLMSSHSISNIRFLSFIMEQQRMFSFNHLFKQQRFIYNNNLCGYNNHHHHKWLMLPLSSSSSLSSKCFINSNVFWIKNFTKEKIKIYDNIIWKSSSSSSLKFHDLSFKSSSKTLLSTLNRLTEFDDNNVINRLKKPIWMLLLSLLSQRPEYYYLINNNNNIIGNDIGQQQQQSSIRVFSSNSTSNIDNNNDDDDDNRIKSCWKCDKPLHEHHPQQQHSNVTNGLNNVQVLNNNDNNNNKIIIKCPHCQTIQPISKNVNYFQLFNILEQQQQQTKSTTTTTTTNNYHLNYNIDLEYLRKNYLCLQQNMHPDMNINRSNIENELSSTNSSIINDGYKILRDPYQRAIYMLQLMFNIIIDEVNVDSEPELLLEIMELNEEIELANNDHDGQQILMEQLEENIEKLIKNLTIAFDELNASEARKLTIKYSYYNNALAKLKSSILKNSSK
ncbi:iron-sulfur cluster co-chaperone protein HscB-like protein, mitochondrial isoform X2 [Dermatophagoides pteronyssinus]|uniref:iron-sulfur cluster co-chaperone protein HscB-like protein, mitochondrial isoform X2 n=1 Tax=Dermatophagoides pteronyssinus TaxID=6956 RepID=UPI003F67BB3C